MTNNKRKPVVSYHTSCLQEDMALVPKGSGAFAVILRSELSIYSPYDAQAIKLRAGMPLLGRAQVDDLTDEVNRHLYGLCAGSELRLGVALLLGHEPDLGSDQAICADIDSWLGANTAFMFWPRTRDAAGIIEEGFFAGVAQSWASQPTDPLTIQ